MRFTKASIRVVAEVVSVLGSGTVCAAVDEKQDIPCCDG